MVAGPTGDHGQFVRLLAALEPKLGVGPAMNQNMEEDNVKEMVRYCNCCIHIGSYHLLVNRRSDDHFY